MNSAKAGEIPHRLETLRTLRLMERGNPLLMLGSSETDFGTRWTVGGQEVQPAIARYLMEAGFVSESGRTQLGACRLTLTESGRDFRDRGLAWWGGLNWLQKLKVALKG